MERQPGAGGKLVFVGFFMLQFPLKCFILDVTWWVGLWFGLMCCFLLEGVMSLGVIFEDV